MPIYNEHECIEQVLQSWHDTLAALQINFRILALNDGSTDDTAKVLQNFADNQRIIAINKKNSGHGPTILKGYRQAVKDAKWVFQCDSDNEMGPEHFKKLWNERQDYDAVFGIRSGRSQNLGRKTISFTSRLAIKYLFASGVTDVNTPYRLIRSIILKKIIVNIPDNTFAPNIIISGIIAKQGHRILNLPVPHQNRQTGTVSITNLKLWRSAGVALWQTIIARNLIYSSCFDEENHLN